MKNRRRHAKSIWYSIAIRVGLPVVLMIILFVSAIVFLIIPSFRHGLLTSKQEMLEDLTTVAVELLGDYQRRVEQGELTLEEAQNRAKERLRAMRYGPDNKDYFWINDTDCKMVMHPWLRNWEGQDATTLTDVNGKRIIVEFVKAVSDDGHADVEYMWPAEETGKATLKLSCVKLYKPWGWIIGTGVYIEDVQAAVSEITGKLNRAFICVVSVLVIILGYITWQGVRGEKERSAAEQALRESEEKYRLFLEQSLLGVVIIQDDVVKYANQIAAVVLDYAPEDLLALPPCGFAETLFPDHAEAVIALSRKVQAGQMNEIIRGVWEAKTKFGETKWLELYSHTINYKGRPAELVSVIDATARKRAEDAMLARQRFLDAVIEQNPLPMWVADEHGTLQRTNPALLNLLNLSEEQLVGKYNVLEDPLLEKQGLHQEFLTVFREGKTVNFACQWDGNDIPSLDLKGSNKVDIEGIIFPIINEKQEVTNAIIIYEEVSERKRVQEELQASERNYREIFNAGNDAIFIHDSETGEIYDVNQTMCDMYGYTRQEAVQMSVGDMSSGELPYSQANVTNLVQKVHEEGPQIFEWHSKKKNGELFWVEVNLKKVVIGGQERLLALARDITERKKAEETIISERDRANSYLELANTMFLAIDRHKKVTLINRKGCEVLGYSEKDVIGKDWFEKFLPDDIKESALDVFGQIISGDIETQEYHENAVLTKDGEERIIAWHNSLLKDVEGNITGVLSCGEDITERKQAEDEIRRLRNYLKNIVDSMPSMLIGVDTEGHVTQWNREAERVTGVTGDFAYGRTLEDVFPYLAGEMEKVRQAIKNRKPIKDSKIAHKEAEETRFSDVTVYPLVANGVEGAVIRVDDITERVQIEEMMIQSEKMLSVGGLAAGMAHEINNPLAGIVQNIQVIENRFSTDMQKNRDVAIACETTIEKIHEYMEQRGMFAMFDAINESGRRAAAIVENMLSFSRKGGVSRSSHDIGELLDKTVELAANDYDLRKKYDFRHIEIVRQYDPATPAVPCESSKIQQVFLNLLKNGAHAMMDRRTPTSEPPRFTLRIMPEKDWVRIEIQDNGPGMDEKDRKRVFEPFFTTKGIQAGTGLGLSVSYFIISENHGGSMTVESSPGNGAKFIVRLPLERRT